MQIVKFYDDIDSLFNQSTSEVGDVKTNFNIIFNSSWCIIILITIIYDLFKVQ